MAAHDLVIENGTGSAVRGDINNYIAASASNFSNGTPPTGANTQPYQWFVNTGDNTLRMRDGSNSGSWIVVGTVGVTNLGLAPTASPTFTGTADFNSNTAIKCPDGTTGERPGSAAVGMLRYNTTTNSFEGYSGSSPSWGEIGGAGAGATGGNSGANAVFWENQVTVTHDYTLTASRGAGTFGGPDGVTISDGVTVTIPDTSTWTII